MMAKLSDWIHRLSTGRVALAALVIFVLFTTLVLPGQTARSATENRSARSPDMSFFYTAQDLYQAAREYGPAGRAAYIQARFTFDLAWPLVYLFFLSTGISWLFRRACPPGSLWLRANLAPVLGWLFDYLENIATSLVMARYPDPTPVLDQLAPVFTLVKWLFVGGSCGLLVLGAAAWAWQRLRASCFCFRRD